MIYWIWRAVVFSLIFVAGNAMAMALRERTTEVAVLKAIGFSRGLMLFLVLAEAMMVAGLGRSASASLGSQGASRLRRRLSLHGGLPSVLLRALERGLARPGGLACCRVSQRHPPGDPRGQPVGRRRPEEGDLNRHDSAQI